MYHLSLYIIKKLLFLFSIAILVICFILMSGIIFKLFNKGANLYNIAEIILLIAPESLAFSMPLGLLIATMLTYSKLSSNQELIAMRSSGINMWQIIFVPLLLSIFIAIICFSLHFYIIPNSKYKLKTKLKSIALKNPSLFITPEESVEIFHNQFIYVDNKNFDQLTGVFIKIFDNQQRISQIISADSGAIFYTPQKHSINLPLEKVSIINYKYNKDETPSIVRLNAKKWQLNHHFRGALAQQPLLKRDKYLDLGEILARYRLIEQDKTKTKYLLFQIHKKMVLSLSPLALIMISLSFGLKIGQRETGHILLITLGLALLYFITVAIAESIVKTNISLASVFIWLPNIAYQIIGITNIKKISAT